MDPARPHSLQTLIWPEKGLSTERDLYTKLSDAAALSISDKQLHFAVGGRASFNTYFNIFNLGKWTRNCALKQLSLALRGKGRFELVVFFAEPNKSWERLTAEVVTLHGDDTPHITPIDTACFETRRGVLFFEVCALSEGHLSAATWETDQPPLRRPQMMLSITTFKREEAVGRSVARFEEFMKTSLLREYLHLIVVDNGRSAGIETSEHVTAVNNENLGGSGGFARGLLEARARGASHCLFMDDDAAVHMQSVERTWTYLAYATDPATAVAGAMANAQHRWQLWENGAEFNTVCRARFPGTDLRDPGQVMAMEFASTAAPHHSFYGGWWYFAFPLDHAEIMPFPFFVRGDDISFGIINPFNTVTLPGVMSFQDENFANKESGQTFYLDVRSHLGIHLGLPSMEIGRKGMMRIVAFFFLRSFLTCHYESLAAIHIGLSDAIEGPDFFARNADMANRRKVLSQIPEDEVWRPIEGNLPSERIRLDMHHRLLRGLMKITLNGHLLPFFGYFGNHVVLPSALRGHRHAVWGAARITYVDADGKRSYTVQHDKRKAFRQGWTMLRSTMELVRDYDAIRDRWRSGYRRLTTQDFWLDKLKMPARVPEGASPQASVEGASPTSA